MPTSLKRWLIVLLVLAVIILVGGEFRRALGIEFDVESVRAFAEGLGPAGPILFIVVVALRSALALPSQVVLIAAGLCFGTLIGTLVGATGLMLSGLGVFLGVRYAGRDSVERRFGTRFNRVFDAAGHRAGAIFISLGMGYPIAPLTPIQAAAGLTPMRISVFILAAFLGGVIRAGIFSYFGNAFTESSRMNFLFASIGLGLLLLLPLSTVRGRVWVRSLLGLDPPVEIVGATAIAPVDVHANAEATIPDEPETAAGESKRSAG